MVTNYVSRVKLAAWLAGGLLVLMGGPATAGILFTLSVMNDFVVKDAELDYDPPLTVFNNIHGEEEFPATDDNVDGIDLYLSSSGGSSEVGFEVLQTSSINSSGSQTKTLLAGVFESMHGDKSAGGFDFLVMDNSVDSTLFPKYGGRGLAVAVRGLDGSQWDSVYRSLSLTNPVLSQAMANGPLGDGVPAAPAPGTLALLLAAGIPLLTTRRRR
jgi:hypothetical protein